MGMIATGLLLAAATAPAGDQAGGADVTSLVGLLNYGVLGILAVGFIRGWVVAPRERDRLLIELDEAKKDARNREAEIARLNEVIQDNLQAMTATMDKQIDLARATYRREEPSGHGHT